MKAANNGNLRRNKKQLKSGACDGEKFELIENRNGRNKSWRIFFVHSNITREAKIDELNSSMVLSTRLFRGWTQIRPSRPQ